MEWLATIKKAVQYIEDNLLTVEGVDEIATYLAISPSYLQQGFQIMTDYSIAEYMRNRRLHQAARDLIASDAKITDIALKYGYDNSASFSKAFSRFHEASPSEVRKGARPRSFLPIKVSVTVRGGQNLDVEIVRRDAFKVIGFTGIYTPETCYEISKRWKDFNIRYGDLGRVRGPRNDIEKAMLDNNFGSCGVTEYPANVGEYKYVFGGLYQGGDVPSGMEIYEIREATWAVFTCVGKLPGAMEELSDLIWKHWVTGNTEYKVDGQCEFELYYEGDYYNDPEYLCTKWIPVKRIK